MRPRCAGRAGRQAAGRRHSAGRATEPEYGLTSDALDRTRAEEDQISERPPALHVEALRVAERRAQRDGIPVNVGNDSQLHAPQPRRDRYFLLTTNASVPEATR